MPNYCCHRLGDTEVNVSILWLTTLLLGRFMLFGLSGLRKTKHLPTSLLNFKYFSISEFLCLLYQLSIFFLILKNTGFKATAWQSTWWADPLFILTISNRSKTLAPGFKTRLLAHRHSLGHLQTITKLPTYDIWFDVILHKGNRLPKTFQTWITLWVTTAILILCLQAHTCTWLVLYLK